MTVLAKPLLDHTKWNNKLLMTCTYIWNYYFIIILLKYFNMVLVDKNVCKIKVVRMRETETRQIQGENFFKVKQNQER